MTDGEKRIGKGICLDAKYLRGKSSATIVEKGKFVYAGDNIMLVDGENSGEVFNKKLSCQPQRESELEMAREIWPNSPKI